MIEDTTETPVAEECIAAISIEADVDDADHYDRDGETVKLLSAAGQIEAPETNANPASSDDGVGTPCEPHGETSSRKPLSENSRSSRYDESVAEVDDASGDRRFEELIATVHRSEAMLQQLLQRGGDDDAHPASVSQRRNRGEDDSPLDVAAIERLQTELRKAEATIGELEEQNESLAARVAGDSVRQTVGSEAGEPMSWEERKEAILRQMENDDFDSEAFIRDLQQRTDRDQEADAATLLDEVWAMNEKLRETCESQKEELSQLRRMMSERDASPVQNDGTLARGAAAIAQMIDSDDLIAEERERLEQLQKDWEEKFRKIEVETSLERAKLSRERQELAERLAEVETELAQTRRQNAVDDQAGGSSRRWLAKLGLES